MKKLPLITGLAVSSLASANAALVINGNFCSFAPVTDPPAGLNSGSASWNDFTSETGKYSGADDTTVSGVSDTVVQFNNGNAVDLGAGFLLAWTGNVQDTHDARVTDPSIIDNGHEQLFGGYLSAPGNAGLQITLAGTSVKSAFETELGKAIDSYDLYLYIDGEHEGIDPEVINYSAELTGGTAPGEDTLFYGKDASDFILLTNGGLGDYLQVTSTTLGSNSAGNFVKFSGITSEDFEVTLTGQDFGVVLNGFEIVAVPEPSSSLVLAGLLALSVIPVRRRS
jgi:hypothetical protein